MLYIVFSSDVVFIVCIRQNIEIAAIAKKTKGKEIISQLFKLVAQLTAHSFSPGYSNHEFELSLSLTLQKYLTYSIHKFHCQMLKFNLECMKLYCCIRMSTHKCVIKLYRQCCQWKLCDLLVDIKYKNFLFNKKTDIKIN